ncbi:MAG: hypothetical protein ACK2U9_21860, partial [Anaerolineae bacterium]
VRTGFLALLLASVYPYAIVSVYSILGVCLLFGFWRRGWQPRLLRDYLTIVALSVPVVLYDGYLVWSDPRLTTGQALYASPGPIKYLLGLGVLAVFGLLGAALVLRTAASARHFLLLWVGVTFVQIYLPRSLVPFQMQLILGVQVPLAILSVLAAGWVWERLTRAAWWRHRTARLSSAVLAATVGALSLVTTVYHVTNVFAHLRYHTLPEYIGRDIDAGIAWLSEHTDGEDVVLASPHVAPYVPVLAHNRVYMANYEAPTADFQDKLSRLQRILGANSALDDDALLAFLTTERIAYIFYDKDLRAMGGDRVARWLNDQPTLVLVFENAAVHIYRVQRPNR